MGCGKTHLALAIADKVIRQHGRRVRFLTVADLLDEIKSTFGKNDLDTREVEEDIKNTPLLILDDYGVESPTNWARERMFHILNYRHFHRLPTVITTNLSLDQMPARIASRMQEADIVIFFEIRALDYRVATREKRNRIETPKTLQYYKSIDLERLDSRVSNRIKCEVKSWLKLPHATPFLYITGGYNSGKTYVLAGMANVLNKKHKVASIIFISTKSLANSLHDSLSEHQKSSISELIAKHVEVKYLFLDDFNSESISKWAKRQIFDILDQRLLRKSPTVISSTLKINQLGSRLRDRLRNENICHEIYVDEGV